MATIRGSVSAARMVVYMLLDKIKHCHSSCCQMRICRGIHHGDVSHADRNCTDHLAKIWPFLIGLTALTAKRGVNDVHDVLISTIQGSD